jgi:hypothetical protein
MSNTNELQATRIDGDEDQGPELVTKWANLEESLRTIFGIPADTVMSEAMQVGTGPNIVMTGTLTLNGQPTADLEAAPKSYVQSIGSGVGIARARAYLTSDYEAASSVYVPWDAADINEQSIWSPVYPTRFTVPSGYAGDYLVGFTMSLTWSGSSYPYVVVQKNRSGSYESIMRSRSGGTGRGMSGLFLAKDMSVGDFIEFAIDIDAASTVEKANSTAWIYNLE